MEMKDEAAIEERVNGAEEERCVDLCGNDGDRATYVIAAKAGIQGVHRRRPAGALPVYAGMTVRDVDRLWEGDTA